MMGEAQPSAWEAPGFLNQTLRIWLVQILTVRGSLPPGVRNVLSSWDPQTGGKTTKHVTVNRGRRLVGTQVTPPAATQSCRPEDPEAQRQQNIAPKQFFFFKKNHSIKGITKVLEYECTAQKVPSTHGGLVTGAKFTHAPVLS